MTIFKVILRVTGGEGAATAALAPKIGPLGLVSCEIFKIFSHKFNILIYIQFKSHQKKYLKTLPKAQLLGKA